MIWKNKRTKIYISEYFSETDQKTLRDMQDGI